MCQYGLPGHLISRNKALMTSSKIYKSLAEKLYLFNLFIGDFLELCYKLDKLQKYRKLKQLGRHPTQQKFSAKGKFRISSLMWSYYRHR